VTKTKKYKTALDEGNDTEGLCYEAKKERLLVLCKEDPGKKLKGQRAIYAWDLKKKKLSKKPVHTIDENAIETLLDKQGIKTKNFHFKPSGLAVHPFTGDIYVISSVGKVLVVLNRKNGIKSVTRLNENVFEQPEGICFMKNGDLLISNEGKKKKGNILLFQFKGSIE